MTQQVIVIGAGIAGAAAAYFLAQGGAEVTVIDAGVHAASQVPSALINPVRGQSGSVKGWALEGMHFTWALLRELQAASQVIPHGQEGVYRPVPDAKTRAKFERNLPATLKHQWLNPADVPGLAPGWHSALFIPEGGWVDGAAFCQALLTASGAQVIREKAVSWSVNSVQIASGTLGADAVVYCGGSVGSTWAGEQATHRAGSMLLFERAVTAAPLSFGAYLSPTAAGGTLGGTFEIPSDRWQAPCLPLNSLRWLLEKGEALTELSGVQVNGIWTGSRLSNLRSGQSEDGVWQLTGLSSKGFLLGPWLAQELAVQITGIAAKAHLRG